MKDNSKYQGIIPAFYACYDKDGADVVPVGGDGVLRQVEVDGGDGGDGVHPKGFGVGRQFLGI